MNHQYQLVRMSANRKLGGLPASVTSDDSCPKRCRLRRNGCYAESGPSGINFRAVSQRRRGMDLAEFCAQIRTLPKRGLWRHNQAGDLPGDGVNIDVEALEKIVHANRGRSGFTYTHFSPNIPTNADAIRDANDQGFTVNLSAETLEEADQFAALGIAPVVVLLPADQKDSMVTPAGRNVIVCPAVTGNTTCALCAICAVADRKTIVGFPSHGPQSAKAQAMFFQSRA